MIQTKDSTVYYNNDPTSAVAKIILYIKSAGQIYVQNRFSEIIDSVAIQPEKYDLLQKEKTDVFPLYRGWLEMQWQSALSAIRRQSPGLYNQVNAQDEKVVKDLYSQLNAIGAKINQLNSPEAKSIGQAVYETYKNETSEISYIPLLGIGYSLTQTRGQKEYELTNHLGNFLVIVTDKRIGVSSSSNSSLIDHYEPDIVSAQDYYPFGMLQPGRSYLSSDGDKFGPKKKQDKRKKSVLSCLVTPSILQNLSLCISGFPIFEMEPVSTMFILLLFVSTKPHHINKSGSRMSHCCSSKGCCTNNER